MYSETGSKQVHMQCHLLIRAYTPTVLHRPGYLDPWAMSQDTHIYLNIWLNW